jgi:hypothetical protein
MAEVVPMTDGVQETLDLIKARILHILEICPILTSSQIHMSLGTSTPSPLWRPVLMALVADGEVVKCEYTTQTPLGRNQAYTLYHLPKNEPTHLQILTPVTS